MITIWNRKELIATFNIKEQERVRNILTDNQIDYNIKTVNRMSASPMASGSRSHTGTLGQDMDMMYEYIIYVRKSDYEKAIHLL